MKNERVWASPALPVPSASADGLPLFRFPLLKSHLSRNVSFFVMTRDEAIPTTHPLPNLVVGRTEVADIQLKTLL